MAEQGTPCGAQEALWKQGGALQQDYRAEVAACRVRRGKAEVPLELTLARVEGRQQGFLKCVNSTGSWKENIATC